MVDRRVKKDYVVTPGPPLSPFVKFPYLSFIEGKGYQLHVLRINAAGRFVNAERKGLPAAYYVWDERSESWKIIQCTQ